MTTPPSTPRCLGLTGGIGSGKSTALAAFARCGAATQSSDEVVHALYGREDVIAAVAARFGADVVGADGVVDRATVGARAFAQDGGIRFLESLLHPLVGEARTDWVRRMRAAVPPPRLIVCEVPLLFELGLQEHFDAVAVVTASPGVRRARVEARGQAFAERAGLQWPEERKVAAADRAFTNDGDMAALQAWVCGLMDEYGTPRR